MNLDKFPRWALIAICGVFMGISIFFASRAIAENDKTKATAEQAMAGVTQLQNQVADVRGAQETFRKEYREDQKDLDKKLVELLRVVKSTA